jgi:hypothetical protein
MTEPLRVSLDVACSVEHAFHTWTSRIDAWWPRDHTVTGRADLVVLQGTVGGRIYERTSDGTEHDWGEITVWKPPTQLAYLWHLGRDRGDATEVEIHFVAQGDSATRVEIEHRGWQSLAGGDEWRDRNHAGWQTLLPRFLAEITKGTADEHWH